MNNVPFGELLHNLEYEWMATQLKKSTRRFNAVDYEKIYSLHLEAWGINSPACILYKQYFNEHPYSSMLPTNVGESGLIAVNQDAADNPRFIHFLEQHEYREYYVRAKTPKMRELDDADYRLEPHLRRRPAHRLAVYYDFSLAKKEGLLGEYRLWWENYYQREHERINNLDESELDLVGKAFPRENRRGLMRQLVEGNCGLRRDISTLVSQGTRLET